MSINSETKSVDVEFARKLGWTEERIELASQAMQLIVRGTSMALAFDAKTGCEHCGALAPRAEHLPCGACDGAGNAKW